MGFTFSGAELSVISTLRAEAENSLRPYSDVYKAIFFYMSEFSRSGATWQDITDQEIQDATPDSTVTQAERSTWLWLRGAYQANSGDGSFTSNFIRDYTSKQYELRYGTTLTEQELQDASDTVANNFAFDITEGEHIGTVPSIEAVAELDGGLGVAPVFTGADYTGNYSPWSGSVLFSFLGTGEPFRDYILQEGRVLNSGTIYFKAIPGTYDLVSVAQTAWDTASLWDSWGNSDELAETIANNSLGTTATLALLSDLRAEANAFFQSYYGLPDTGLYQIGGDLPLYGGSVLDAPEYISRPNYIVGTLGDDMHIEGLNPTFDPDNNFLGNDIINAGLGNDFIFGSGGSDLIDGAEGEDKVDYLFAGAGLRVNIDALEESHTARYIASVTKGIFTDMLYNVEGIKGSIYDDVFNVEFLKDGVELNASLGRDSLDGSSQTGALTFDLINGQLSGGIVMPVSGFEEFVGGSGGDSFKMDAVEQSYTLRGNEGFDVADYSQSNAFLKVLSVPGEAGMWTVDKYYGQSSATGLYETDYLYSIEDILGDTGNGISIDGAGGQIVKGDEQQNIYSAPGGLASSFYTYEHNDRMYGSTLNDYFDGGENNDYARGDNGNDVFMYRRGDGPSDLWPEHVYVRYFKGHRSQTKTQLPANDNATFVRRAA